MNGMSSEDGSLVDRRPIITCSGEIDVFSTIENNLSEALPQEACEWRRSLGRPIRSVHIGATFAPYSAAGLPKGNQWDLIRQPLFHIYWTECSDVDVYKSSVKEDIETWLKELSSREIPDWLIVVVENFDGKRANKLLPRTTVLDKIRADFAPKQGDRCISVINPGKSESRSADSWRGLVSRIRHLLLVAYARAVSRLEDHVRQQRERRNDPGWDFMRYFHLQEELAQVLEMLGLYDEALVQYDELDVLFSQFVANGVSSNSAAWLSNFQKPLDRWHGLKLGQSHLAKSPSILELRAYLFAKQAHMLLLLNKVWEMASRCLPFLHTCTREMSILEVSSPEGALACWLFLAAMEVLQTCDKFNHADEAEDFSFHTAGLWEYASQKLRCLGELCGLLPGGTPTSEQLHIVVLLSSGMGDNPGPPNHPSPTDKLKEALCSQDVFNKTYLELTELSMCTYKHTGRLRSARLVGRQASSFYLLLGETQKAAAFLGDALRNFEADGWRELVAQAHIELAECYRRAGDPAKLVVEAARVAGASEVDTLERWSYFEEMRKCIESLQEPVVIPFGDIIKIMNVSVKNDGPIMQDTIIEVELVIDSNFPREFVCSNLMMSLEPEPTTEKEKVSEKYCLGRTLTSKDMKTQDPRLQRLKMKKILDYKQDKQLAMAGVSSKFTVLKRKDSVPPQIHRDFSNCLEVNKLPLVITPGLNTIRLKKKADSIGKYFIGQVAVHIKKLHLISLPLSPRLLVEIKEEGPTLKLYKTAAPLLSGIEQTMNLILTIGSYSVESRSIIKLTTSPGLAVQVERDNPLVNSLEIEVGPNFPFSSIRRHLRIMADMLSKDHQPY
ncbi:unnamed protein product [Acanthoscelides obtectus]|uniref:Trafficking protein particle complex subunit 10 n=1 Tax=Acanthoscelides obtectus TaxID=200917 RepID=A0A9P0LYX1_ACAOB|nr:unnamed protein product [Acanthoscelides obtectus]CAK1656583.1 Trafficking protein particle complex subunit 10 [Acanthoscelides obtectus]